MGDMRELKEEMEEELEEKEMVEGDSGGSSGWQSEDRRPGEVSSAGKFLLVKAQGQWQITCKSLIKRHIWASNLLSET